MVSPLDRLSYAARQTARVAWYAGHYAAGRRLMKPMPKPDFAIGPTPGRAELTADMRALFQREWRDVAAGLFPAPRLLDFVFDTHLRYYYIVFPGDGWLSWLPAKVTQQEGGPSAQRQRQRHQSATTLAGRKAREVSFRNKRAPTAPSF